MKNVKWLVNNKKRDSLESYDYISCISAFPDMKVHRIDKAEIPFGPTLPS